MRYFLAYYDDTLNGHYRHDSGYLVNRKPMALPKMSLAGHKKNGTKAAGTRLAKSLVKRLERMGL